MIAKIRQFFQDVKSEMAKVSWPTKEELKGETALVIIVSLAFSVFIFAVDHLLSWLIQLIY
ncbi:MAG: preprotein translocase subunit SecE [candidate division KSB1 bacterium]|nr:preprotein translocase subunit SecE [candidate division KSB1 bacterium]